MRAKLIFIICVLLLFCFFSNAQDLDSEITVLSGKLTKNMIAKKINKIACVDFVDLQGRPTELGRYLTEELSVQMVNEEGITVVDRANFKSILAEHNLTLEGLVRPENAKELGKFAGIDAIITGTLTILDNNVVLTVKAISTESAQIVAAAKAVFVITSELQQMSNKAAGNSQEVPAGTGKDTDAKVGTFAGNSIFTQNLGDLRIELKNIRSIKDVDIQKGIQCVFDFVNTNLQNSVLIAANSTKTYGSLYFEAKLVDSNGEIWALHELSGISNVRGVGTTQIVHAIMTGTHSSESAGYYQGECWLGSFTEIPAAGNKRVTMIFVKNNNDNIESKKNDSYQIECELLVAYGNPEQPENCSLTTLMFDDVKLTRK